MFSDIHRNVGLVSSVMIQQRRSSNCNKPVIAWPFGRLANLSPSGASRPHVKQPSGLWKIEGAFVPVGSMHMPDIWTVGSNHPPTLGHL